MKSSVIFFPEAKWQRCVVHWYRNAFTMCPWKHLREVVVMLRQISTIKWGTRQYMNTYKLYESGIK
ncbi:transposase [uncultured Victivallis sp.]|uniref:transposase n=1 Tax=uncultured Victivallis sp. TaxID=354118 RepID=UPI00345CB47F